MSSPTNSVRLAWIIVSGTIGDPIVFDEREVAEDVVEGNGGYNVLIRKGRRWETGYVGHARLDVASVSIMGGFAIEGGIWCLASDREAAKTKLAAAVRTLLENVKRHADASLASLA